MKKVRVWDGMHFIQPEVFVPIEINQDGGSFTIEAKHPGYVLQWWSGAKDKQGSDIFEGDIVFVNGKRHVIEWRGHGFYISGTEYSLDTCFFVAGEPVVVGNIFETPELIP